MRAGGGHPFPRFQFQPFYSLACCLQALRTFRKRSDAQPTLVDMGLIGGHGVSLTVTRKSRAIGALDMICCQSWGQKEGTACTLTSFAWLGRILSYISGKVKLE